MIHFWFGPLHQPLIAAGISCSRFWRFWERANPTGADDPATGGAVDSSGDISAHLLRRYLHVPICRAGELASADVRGR
jgi:hypothetical protein